MDEKKNTLTETDARVILSMTENGMRVKAVADKLHYNRSTVDYHIKKIHEITGLNPKELFDLQRLIPIAKTVLESGWEWTGSKWRCSYCKTSLVDMVGGYWDEPSAKPELNYCPECGKAMRGKENG